MELVPVVSPVHGIVSHIDFDTITIYISKHDNHNIYSPITGLLVDIKNYQGHWIRKIFQAEIHKTARTEIYIRNKNLDKNLSFWLEVGKPKYITDRIRLNKKIYDNLIQGEQIGEIILGSLSEVHFNNLDHINIVNIGDKIIGGETIISYIKYY